MCAELSGLVRRRCRSRVMLRQEGGTQHRRGHQRWGQRTAGVHACVCPRAVRRLQPAPVLQCSCPLRCTALPRAAGLGAAPHGRAATRACFGRRRSGLRVRHLLRSAAAGAARRGAPKAPPGGQGRPSPARAQPYGQRPETAAAACGSAAAPLAAGGAGAAARGAGDAADGSGGAPGDQGAAAGEGATGAAGAAGPPSRKAYVRRSKADYAAWAAATPASRAAASQPHRRGGEAGGGGGGPAAGGGAEDAAGGSAAAHAAPGDAQAAGTPGGERRPCTCGARGRDCCAARCACMRPHLVWSHGLPGVAGFWCCPDHQISSHASLPWTHPWTSFTTLAMVSDITQEGMRPCRGVERRAAHAGRLARLHRGAREAACADRRQRARACPAGRLAAGRRASCGLSCGELW